MSRAPASAEPDPGRGPVASVVLTQVLIVRDRCPRPSPARLVLTRESLASVHAIPAATQHILKVLPWRHYILCPSGFNNLLFEAYLGVSSGRARQSPDD